MLTLTWQPNLGSALVLNGANFPIDEELDFDLGFTDPSVKKMQLGGEWPSFGYPTSLRITAEGTILGSSPSNFWANRQAFLNALTPPQTELTSRRHGVLTLDDDDMGESAYAYCRIISRTAKLETLSPERCPFLVVFKAFVPYFTGTVSGNDVVVG
jgi:hypothetical protein